MLRMYFGNNVYNRPFDDRSIPRNRNEARAVEELLRRVADGEIELFSSFVLEFEHSRLSLWGRKEEVRRLMDLAQRHVNLDTTILQNARNLRRFGLGIGDALHFAAAEYAGVDYFVTCDVKLMCRARRLGSSTKAVSTVDLI